MRLLLRSQLRFVGHAPWSAATALLGVTLGVASIVGVHLLSARVASTLDATIPPHLRGLTHVLERPATDADDYFALRDAWRRRADLPIEALVPLLDGYVRSGGRQVRVLGADWLAMPRGGGDDGPRGFRFEPDLLAGGALLVDEDLGLAPGSTLRLAGRDYPVAGVADLGPGSAILADIAVAQQILGRDPLAVDRVGLAVHQPWRRWRELAGRLMPGLGAGLASRDLGLAELVPGLDGAAGWRALPLASQQPSAEFARAVLFNLGALGSLALLVAWFLIYQVGVIWLGRQRLLQTRLHALGVAWSGLRRSFVGLFVVLGSVATLLGLVLGVVLARALTGLTAGELALPPLTADIDLWVLLKAAGSGLGACLLGSGVAFARERAQPAGGSTGSPRWLLLGLPLVVGWGVLVEASGLPGAFLAILAMTLGGALLVGPCLVLLRGVARRLRGSTLTRLALRDVLWHPRLLGVALAALSVAVATAIGIGLMVESFRADFTRMLNVRLAGDIYLEAPAKELADLDRWLSARPEAARRVPGGRQVMRLAGRPVELGYARFDVAESARYGFTRALLAGEALISQRLARDLGVVPGDVLGVDGAELQIVGTFAAYGEPLGRVLVDTATLSSLGLVAEFDRLTASAADGVAPALLVQTIAARFPALVLESREEVRTLALQVFDRTFAITRALTLLALLVAGVGVYCALTALRLQQAASAALLRVQGVVPAQLRWIALVRAGTVGGLATVIALPLGLAMAWTLCAVVNPRSFGWTVPLQLAPGAWLEPLLLGLTAALVAGCLPAPRERGALDGMA